VSIAAVVLSLLLAAVCLGAGAPKVRLKGEIPERLRQHMGLSDGLVRFIGLAELAATAGLIIGIFWRPPGIAAAVGLGILLVGAVAFHARAGDYADPAARGQAAAPIVLAAAAIAAAITLAMS
jgi:uncharacterized membrane protein YphA (DoxX/SURF4 family)